jgi:hypothetical protein
MVLIYVYFPYNYKVFLSGFGRMGGRGLFYFDKPKCSTNTSTFLYFG